MFVGVYGPFSHIYFLEVINMLSEENLTHMLENVYGVQVNPNWDYDYLSWLAEEIVHEAEDALWL